MTDAGMVILAVAIAAWVLAPLRRPADPGASRRGHAARESDP